MTEMRNVMRVKKAPEGIEEDAKSLLLGLDRPEWVEMVGRSKEAYAPKGMPSSVLGQFSEFGVKMEAPDAVKKRRIFE